MITIHCLNMEAGQRGDRLLKLVNPLPLYLVGAWETPGADGGGNCFFATVQMMALLIEAGKSEGFVARSGVFEHPDMTEAVVHSWLERSAIVMNVSNLRTRPLYVTPRARYYSTNFVGRRFEPIPPARVRRVLKRHDGDVREATKRLFKPAMTYLGAGRAVRPV